MFDREEIKSNEPLQLFQNEMTDIFSRFLEFIPREVIERGKAKRSIVGWLE